MEEDIAVSNTLLDLNELQCHPGPDLETQGWEELVSPCDWGCGSHREPSLTSVSRMALCWACMFPRPATACGSSVILCSPSGSTSLSDSATPLCRTAHHLGCSTWAADPCSCHPAFFSRGQQLTDVLQSAHVGKLLLQKFLHAPACTHRNHFDAAAVVRAEGGVKGHGVQGQLLDPSLLYMHQGVYFESEQSHSLSSRVLIRCMACPTLSPSHQHSLVSEVQLLGVRVVVNKEASLNGVQVHLGAREMGPMKCLWTKC